MEMKINFLGTTCIISKKFLWLFQTAYWIFISTAQWVIKKKLLPFVSTTTAKKATLILCHSKYTQYPQNYELDTSQYRQIQASEILNI